MNTPSLRVMITGAARGIGLALTRTYLQRGARVLATIREPAAPPELAALASEQLTVCTMDIASTESVRAARAQLAEFHSARFAALDVLIHNAATNGGPQQAPGMNLEQVARVLDVNATGAVRVYDAFVDLLRAAPDGGGTLVNISSEAGSLSVFRASGKPEYAMSKAALNALTRWIAARDPAVLCVSLDPGWTRTAMGGPDAPSTPEDTAARIADAVASLTREHSGGFYRTDLTPVPW